MYADQFNTGVPLFDHTLAASLYLERPDLPPVPPELKLRPEVVPEFQSWSIWLCPDDAVAIAEAGNFNYLPSIGLGPTPPSTDGAHGDSSPNPNRSYGIVIGTATATARLMTTSELTAGSSQTVVMSERLIETGLGDVVRRPPSDEREGIWYAGPPSGRPTLEWLEQACRDSNDRGTYDATYVIRRGMRVIGGIANGFAAVTPPNGRTCYPDEQPPPGTPHGSDTGGPAATSWHWGFVNVSYGDGHAGPASNAIDVELWRTLNNVR